MDAITGCLVEGAYAEFAKKEFAKNKKGVLKDGYLGDAVVLSGDIETTPHEETETLSAVVTMCGGE